MHTAYEPPRALDEDTDAEHLCMPPQHALIPCNDPKTACNLVARQGSVLHEHVAQQDDVVIFAEDAVERLDPALVREQMVSAASFEQPHVEPMVLDTPTPGMEPRRPWFGPRVKHHAAGALVAFLEAWSNRLEAANVDPPVLDAFAFVAQRAGGDLH